MKKWKFCVNSGFFGKRRDRFTEYQPDRSLEEKFNLISKIEAIEGVELKYPFDLKDVTHAKQLLKDHNLICSAVNVDIKDAAYFRYGALSARSSTARDRAVTMLREGMDAAVELGADMVSTCPLAEGYDYPFQLDYTDAWGYLVESIKAVAAHRSDVKLAIEFQPHEPHSRILLGNVGKMLHVCAEVGAENFGANLDIGHSFAALESPAESASLLAGKGKLFYVHTNDNTGDGGDWDMVSGTVHFWHWIELLVTLNTIGYDDWLGGDIAPKHMGPVEAFDINTRMIQRMIKLLDRIGVEKLQAMIRADGNTHEIYDCLSKSMFPEV